MHAPEWVPVLAPATALAVYAVRRLLPVVRQRLPDWAVPVLATALGALAAHFGLDASPVGGAVAGLAATGAWATGQQVARARRLRAPGADWCCAHCGHRTALGPARPTTEPRA